MSEITTPVDAVYAAYYASFDCPSYEVNNPDRGSLDADRFVKELGRIGWRPDVTSKLPDAVRYPLAFVDSVLECADDDAVEEGGGGDCNGDYALNSWSADTFVASCEREGVEFMVSA